MRHPSHPDEERAADALLGALAGSPSDYWRAAGIVAEDVFERRWHGQAFAWLLRRGRSGVGGRVEPGELVDALVAAGNDERRVRVPVADMLSDHRADATTIEPRARELARLAYGRRLVDALRSAGDTARVALARGEALDDVRAEVLRMIAGASGGARGVEGATVSEAHEILFNAMREAQRTDGAPGLTWGIPDLDRAIGGGMRPGQLSVVAARLKVGKSHLAVHAVERAVATSWAHLGGRPAAVLFIAMEMAAPEMRARALAWHTGVPSDRVALGDVGPAEMRELDAARTRTDASPLRYVTDRGLSIEALADVCRGHAAQGHLDLIVVDYLDLVRRPRAERDDLEVGRVVRGLLALAGEIDAHVLLLAQLNREGAIKPSVHHLAGSDEVARAAHHVLLLEREESGSDVFATKATSSRTARLKIHVTTRSVGTDRPVEVELDYATSRLEPRARSIVTAIT